MSTRLNEGDHVRVVIEGPYRQLFGSTDRYEGPLPEGTTFRVSPDDVATIERVPEPVVQFAAGDVLRRKADSTLWYLTRNGYQRLGRNHSGDPFIPWPEGGHEAFTSETFELVEV